MLDPRRFSELWQRLGGRDGSRVYAELLAAYSDPQRAYHNFQHLEDCLRHFDTARALAEHSDIIEIALWFHDAVYDARAHDNEERSAAWAVRALTADGIATDIADSVAHLIRLTRHNAEADSIDAAIMLDVDLSILGSAPTDFAAYDRNIRTEYAWVPDADYRAGRRAVLERFLQRPRIYHTAPFERLEERARENLYHAIARFAGQ